MHKVNVNAGTPVYTDKILSLRYPGPDASFSQAEGSGTSRGKVSLPASGSLQ